MNESLDAVTVSERGLVTCSECLLVTRPAGPEAPGFCPRCGHPLHQRKPYSVASTWAYVIAAAILYVPANIYPVLTMRELYGPDESNTIMQGVIALWSAGSWPLALVVFFASIVVPLLKILSLIWLVVSIHLGRRVHLRDRTRLYRFIDLIGRWSMLDIFVVALLCALVQLDRLASVRAGEGAFYFAAVVVLTLLATHSFDPRLSWDAAEGRYDGRG